MNTCSTIHFDLVFLRFILFLSGLFSSSMVFSNTSAWQLTCPDDVVVQLGPNECNAAVFFDTLTWSSTEPLADTVFFPASGNFFSIGTSVVTLATTTISGQLEICTFKIIVQEFEPYTLDCLLPAEVSLQGSCERALTVDEIVDLDSIGCANNYLVARIGDNGQTLPPLISADDIGQTISVVAQHQNNMVQCMTQVTVGGGTPAAITCPSDITVSCNTLLLPSITGRPDTTGCFENINIVFFDDTAPTLCADSIGFQTTRSWVATDPLGHVNVCQQVITGLRVNLDLVGFPSDYDGTELPPLLCADSMTYLEVADPVFTGRPALGGFPVDANPVCDISANFQDVVTQVCGASYQIERVWTVVNLCDPSQMARDTQYIVILDTLPPVFELPDTLFASVNTACFDSLLLPAVNLIRECSGFGVNIVTPWDTLSTDGGWTGIDQVSGQYPIVYTLTDECANVASDTIILLIEENTLVSCPPDLTIDCDLYFGTIAPAIGFKDYETLNQQLGVPGYHGNCAFTFSETDSVQINGCGDGFVIRTLTSDSIVSDKCLQVVNVEHISNFTVAFPPDLHICTDPLMADLGEPVISGVSCENMLTSTFDEIIPSGTAGCYTIERTWTITNACSYNNVNNQDDVQLDSLRFMDGGDGVIEHKQYITVNDREGPAFPDGCGFPDLYVFQNNCEITVTVPTPQVEGCGAIDLVVAGDLGEIMGENINLGPGIYNMTFTATDECGKMGVCTDTFAVIDSVGPVALCKQMVAVELSPAPNPIVEIFPSDFDDNSFDNCSGNVLNFYFLTDSLAESLSFGCCDVGAHPLTIVVEDEYGNQSVCNSMVFVQGGPVGCDECDPVISGRVYTENGQGISNVEVTLLGASGIVAGMATDTSGQFSFAVEPGGDYSIELKKNTNHDNGVTTYDAVLMTRHILNVDLLDSPYKIIAADINNSETVTTFDIVELRKLILNIYSNFPNSPSWRFIPADYIFSNPFDPFEEPLPTNFNLNNVVEDISNLNFIGIKTGDVNDSANPHN